MQSIRSTVKTFLISQPSLSLPFQILLNCGATLGSVAYYFVATLGSVAYYFVATLGSVAHYLSERHEPLQDFVNIDLSVFVGDLRARLPVTFVV